jgi:O-antigen biosynthesis protein
LLKDCLSSLRETIYFGDSRVTVVDNNSGDGSRQMVESLFPEVRIINSGGNIGFGRANNLALKNVSTKYILFLNPDTVVLENAIDRMIGVMESDSSIGGVGCKMIYPTGETQPLGIQWFPSPFTELFSMLFVSQKSLAILKDIIPYRDPEKDGYVTKLYGGCLLVRKAVLDKIGYFDEQFFMYGEDVDLSRRILDGGWKLYYTSEARIIHLCGGASEKAPSDFSILMKCDSISKLMNKYYGGQGQFLYRITIFSGACIRWVAHKMVSMLSSSRNRNVDYERAILKYSAMIKWSLKLRRPEIKQ